MIKLMNKQKINNLFQLNNKTAVIIGAGGHLCSEMARGLAYNGCSVALLDIRIHKVEKIQRELKSNGYNKVICQKINAEKKQDHIKALAKIIKRFNKVDILINGAGINSPKSFFDIELNEWNSVISSQLTATFLGCQIFGKHMVKNQKGSIINISSASAGPPLSKAFAYSASKAGIKNLTQNLGREWGKEGVRVNAIRPGFFPTEWNKKNFITPKRKKSILNHTPMNRYGNPNELIGAILWLASDSSSFVTGTEIAIDGGFSSMTI